MDESSENLAFLRLLTMCHSCYRSCIVTEVQGMC